MKKLILPILLISIICFSSCGKKIDYTGYYNYTGENNGFSEYKVSIHITQDENGVYTIAIKDGDYATDVILIDNQYEFGNKYHGSFTYDGDFRQKKTYSFIADPSDYPDLEFSYDSDIMVDLQFNGNILFYRNSKSLGITGKDEFKKYDFIQCDKVIVD
jgi:hypothetical protein